MKTSARRNYSKHDRNRSKLIRTDVHETYHTAKKKNTAREQQSLHLQTKWKYFFLHGTRYVQWSKTTQMTSKPAVAIFLVGVDQSGQPTWSHGMHGLWRELLIGQHRTDCICVVCLWCLVAVVGLSSSSRSIIIVYNIIVPRWIDSLCIVQYNICY